MAFADFLVQVLAEGVPMAGVVELLDRDRDVLLTRVHLNRAIATALSDRILRELPSATVPDAP